MDKIFTSKATTLKILKNKLRKSKVEKLYNFTVIEWTTEPNKILERISSTFTSNQIIIRSSALDEDSWESSQAGYYESILNVNTRSKKLISQAINSVIKSYKKNGNENTQNQILIQEQAKNISYSGVIFTRTPDHGKPYYIINYEYGSSTDGVTKGEVSDTIKIFRKINLLKLPKHWNLLLKSVREIERVTKSDKLDIEFGITKKYEIIIFQVRPLVSIREKNMVSTRIIEKHIDHLKKEFNKKFNTKPLQGDHTIFSDMTDWNPAEIIGNNPHNLDYSIYDFIIMQSAWHEGRSRIGYNKLKKCRLMHKFGNKPYVDVRSSFNSLLPSNIRIGLKRKLIHYYLDKLKRFPHLHDKAEFEILFTCYDFSIKDKLSQLKSYNFTQNEINEIECNLLEFTNTLIENFPQLSNECKVSINHLKKNREKILTQLNNSERRYKELIFAAEQLLHDCKEYGAVSFSLMARIAFIASKILKSLVSSNIITQQYYDEFMQSIETILSQFQNDVIKYQNNTMTKRQFLKKYGHIRPGTYDICVPRYEQNHQFLEELKLQHITFNKKFSQKRQIKKVLESRNLIFSKISLSNFIKQALIEREELKFVFTKNLSDALELLAEAAEKLNFSRYEIANLEISSILKYYRNQNKKSLIKIWRKKINTQKTYFSEYENLVLPPIISSDKDFEIITYPYTKPNYVTTKKISSHIINPDELSETSVFANKIILLENADPGYDWIFSHKLSGLITKYGGVASHMAIRCAEIGLPAAIGCGETIYEKLLSSSIIMLDCKNQQILILKNKKLEKYAQEKLILKSLGYIK